MARVKGYQKPRALESQAIEQPYYKAGMPLELQKFGNRERQLQRGPIIGVNLPKSQNRALHAIQKLMDKTDYKGNLPGENTISVEFNWKGYIPTLSFTPTEYFQAYELEPAGDGRYHGSSVKEAIEGLKSLMNVRHYVVYDRKIWRNGKEERIVIRATTPLIIPTETFENVTDEELERIREGKELPERITKMTIIPSPLLLDGIKENFYALKPTGLYTEIQELYPGKKYPYEIILFIEWLFTLNRKKIPISRDRLAEKLKMDKLIEHRRQKEIDRRIKMALETALELEYLLSYDIEVTGLIRMELNPERIKRIGMKKRGRNKGGKETE